MAARPVPAVLRAHGALSRATFAVTVLLSLAVLFAPARAVPAALPGVDLLVHLGLFAALALSGRWAGIGAAVLATALVAYAAGSEVVQAVAPLRRSGSATDWLADVAGTVAGLAAWTRLAVPPGPRGTVLRPGSPPGD